jgi:PKD domain
LAGFTRSRACRRVAFLVVKALVVACAMTAVVAAAGAAPATSPAPPRWLTARDLSEAGADAVIPDAAVDPRGNLVVVWAQAKESDWTVQVVDRPVGGKWSAPLALSVPANHVASPQVAIAGSNTVAVWERYDGQYLIAQAADRDAKTGTWAVPTSLSAPGRDADSPRVAVDARGDAVAVWASVGLSGWTVQAAYRPAGGAWGTVVALEPPQQGTAAPEVVLDSSGRAVAVWASTSGSGWRVHAAYGGAEGAWSQAIALSGPDATGSLTPQVGLEGSGDVTAVWSRSIGTRTVIQSATRDSAGGAWSPPRQISPNGPDAVAPSIAVNNRGDAVAVWTSSDPSGLSVVADVRKPGKDWGPSAVLAGAVSGPLAPQIALDARGDALAVWSHSPGGHSRVQAAGRLAGSTSWSQPRDLSMPGADALTPQVTLDTDGDGAAVWARYNGQTFVVQGAGYDGSGPALDKLAVPASGVVGKRLTFAVAPTDVWAAVRTIRWRFGDGSAGQGRLIGHAYARPGRYAAQVTATDSFGHVRSVRRWVRISAG